MACVYFSYAAANWFCSKNALAWTLRRASTFVGLDMGGVKVNQQQLCADCSWAEAEFCRCVGPFLTLADFLLTQL